MWKNIRKTINSERNNIDYCELIEKINPIKYMFTKHMHRLLGITENM